MTAELILYATPTGPLATALDSLFAEITEVAPTRAQDYPPHCTLTGFFHRDPADIGRVLDELARTELALGPLPADGVDIVELHRRADWVGLELRSEWLAELTRRFVDTHTISGDDDALRPKDWLHLSIAYGADDLSAAAALSDGFDISRPVTWQIGLWQRNPDGSWRHLHP